MTSDIYHQLSRQMSRIPVQVNLKRVRGHKAFRTGDHIYLTREGVNLTNINGRAKGAEINKALHEFTRALYESTPHNMDRLHNDLVLLIYAGCNNLLKQHNTKP